MSDSIFCRILAGEFPASFVYRDAVCAAFMDIQPVNPVHQHVFTRFRGDGSGLRFSPEHYTRRRARAELDEAPEMLQRRMPAPGAA